LASLALGGLSSSGIRNSLNAPFSGRWQARIIRPAGAMTRDHQEKCDMQHADREAAEEGFEEIANPP